MNELTRHTDTLTHERNTYALAVHNMHKPWARRWLRENGHMTTITTYKARKARAHKSDEHDLGGSK